MSRLVVAVLHRLAMRTDVASWKADSRRVPGLAADRGPPASRSHPSDLCAPLQPATPASGTGVRGTRASRSRRRGRPRARHRTARSHRWARPRVSEGGMIEYSYPTGGDEGP